MPDMLHRAHIAVALGDRERAMTLLRELVAYPEGSMSLHRLHEFEPLWGYLPFEELLRRNRGA